MKSVGTYATGTTLPDGTPRRAIGYFDSRYGCAFSLPASLNGWQLATLKDCAAILAGESVRVAMNEFNIMNPLRTFEVENGFAPFELSLDAALEQLPCSELDDLVRSVRFWLGSRFTYVEPAKQVLVVIGGVTFTSLPVGPAEARALLESVKRSAPNTDPMIVVSQ